MTVHRLRVCNGRHERTGGFCLSCPEGTYALQSLALGALHDMVSMWWTLDGPGVDGEKMDASPEYMKDIERYFRKSGKRYTIKEMRLVTV